MDFEIFRADSPRPLGARDRAKGGRPSFDPVLKFRMLVLQAMHGLSLAQTEYLVADRLSWMRFCGLGPGDAVPDANTLWDFREALIAAGALDALFDRLDRAITEAGYLPMAGQIVDATLVAAPRQRNTEAEKARIKAGEKASGDLARQAGQGAPEGHGCALDGEVLARRNPPPTASRSSTSPSRPSATSRISRSTAGTGSSGGRRSPTRRRMTARGCAKG